MIETRLTKEVVNEIANYNQEPAWLIELRKEAFTKIENLPLPYLTKTKIDKWNFTNFNPLDFSDKIDSFCNLPKEMQNIVIEQEGEENYLLFRNANLVYQKVASELQEKGVLFLDLPTAIKEHGDLVKEYFLRLIRFDENKLTALHTTFFTSGIFIYVPKNVEVELPLYSLFYADQLNTGILQHIIIVAESNSSLTYVDHFHVNPKTASSLNNSMVEIFAHEGAKVRFVSIQDQHDLVTSHLLRRAYLEKDAKVEWFINELNAGPTISNNFSILKGKGSYVNTNTLSIGVGKQRMNLTQQAEHIGEYTNSEMLTKAVMLDEAHGIFNSITKINKNANESNGGQTAKVLMLSEKARGDANPILLIDENDVKADHAASVGKINPNDLYYLMSRGITKREAEKLIIKGFLAPIIEQIPLKNIYEHVITTIERKLINR